VLVSGINQVVARATANRRERIMHTNPDTAVRTRLSWMWVFVMLNMAYADILGFMDANILMQFLAGHAEQITITPSFLLLAAVLTEIPLAMVVLSQLLPRDANRWTNIAVSVFTVVYIWGGGVLSLPHYIFIASLETAGCLYIAWTAWRRLGSEERVIAGVTIAE
jgi:Family of unknown function (DUF6326)